MSKRKRRADEDTTLRTIAYAAERLGCGRVKIYSLVQQGRLELVKFDSRSRITDRSLRKLLKELMQKTDPKPAA